MYHKQYYNLYQNLLKDALQSIARYDGANCIVLATGERALDWDDAWLILDKWDVPSLRGKKDQRIFEKTGQAPASDNDTPITTWEPFEIFELADRLAENKKDATPLIPASYDVGFNPMTNVITEVRDPENPTDEEKERIILQAARTLFGDDSRAEDVTSLELYSVGGQRRPLESKIEIEL